MKNILRKYPEVILTLLALVLLGILISYFSWGIGDMVAEVNRAANAKGGGGETINFDLRAAQSLDFRGLAKPQP